MSILQPKQRRLKIAKHQKREVRTQFGALCYRVEDGETQVLLVTTRGRKRWMIPKGWPMPGQTPSQAAQTEAFEEAGVEGTVTPVCLGLFSYTKLMPKADNLPCMVAVYPLEVTGLLDDYPEARQRRRKWMSLKKAANKVDNTELAMLLRMFHPDHLPR